VTAAETDQQLVAKVQKGDARAFDLLVLKYQHRIFGLIGRYVHDADEVQDVAQEAFIKAYRALPDFRGESAFYTWLYRIAFNVAASHRRRKKPTLSVEYTREVSGEEPLDSGQGPTDRLEQADRCRQVHEALAQLSEEHRVVVVLREIEGCCYETIAEVLELPIGTVRSRLHRARLQLKELLKGVLTLDE